MTDDLISRQAVLEIQAKYAEHIGATKFWQMRDDIEALPPVTLQEPKTGHWIAIDEEPHEDYECDRCGYIASTWCEYIKPSDEYKYCPNCGAKMIEPQESEG